MDWRIEVRAIIMNGTTDRYLELDKIFVYDVNVYYLDENEKRELQRLARSITTGNKISDVLRLSSWVSEIPWDVSLENIHPLKLVGSRGDCYFHSLLFAALARSLGIPTRFVEEVRRIPEHVTANFPQNADTFGKNFTFHVWCEVFVTGSWIPVDPTENIVGKQDFELYFKYPEYLKIKVIRDETVDATDEYALNPLKKYAEEFGLLDVYSRIESAYTRLNSDTGCPLYYCRPFYENKEKEIEQLYQLLLEFNRKTPKKYIGYRGFIPVEMVQSWMAHLWEYSIGTTGNVMIITDTELIKERERYEDFVMKGGSLLVAAMNNVQIFYFEIKKPQNDFERKIRGKANTPFGYFEDITVLHGGEIISGEMYLENVDRSREDRRFYFGALAEKGKGRVAVVNYALLMPYRDHRVFIKHLLNWLFDVQL